MKSLLLALALTGMAYTVSAQSSANSKFAKNYPVCLTGNQYQICDRESAMNQDIGHVGAAETFGMSTTYVHLGYTTGGNARYRSRIRVTYDEPGAAYEGKETMINDGVKKNEKRNLNTNNGAYNLPPSDGGSL